MRSCSHEPDSTLPLVVVMLPIIALLLTMAALTLSNVSCQRKMGHGSLRMGSFGLIVRRASTMTRRLCAMHAEAAVSTVLLAIRPIHGDTPRAKHCLMVKRYQMAVPSYMTATSSRQAKMLSLLLVLLILPILIYYRRREDFLPDGLTIEAALEMQRIHQRSSSSSLFRPQPDILPPPPPHECA